MIGGGARKDIVGGIPRVDLMPPEVAQRRADRRAQWWVIVALVAVAGLAVVGTALAAFSNTIAQANLMTAQAQTEMLLAQQQEYAEVSGLLSSIALAEQATVTGTASEVLWLDAQREVLSVLPVGASVTTLAGTSDAAWTTTMLPAGPLRQPRVASFTINVTTTTLDDVAAYLRALENLEIVADATADSVQVSVGYVTIMTVNIDPIALSLRFTDEYEPRVAGGGAAAPTPTPSPEATPTPEATEEASE
mgnify:CR=1 FL=1